MNSVPTSVGFDEMSLGTECKLLSSEMLERLSLQTPLGHFRFCTSLLDRARCLGRADEIELNYEVVASSVFARNYQPSMAAIALLADYLQKPNVAIAAQLFISGAPKGILGNGWLADRVLGIPIAHQLALLWEELALKREDHELLAAAKKAFRWIEGMGGAISPLFCRELIGQASVPFFADKTLFCADSCFGSAGFCSDSASAHVTLTGWNTGFGALRANDIEVRAFGPQSLDLDNTKNFGIAQLGSSQGSALIEGRPLADEAFIVSSDASVASVSGWTRCLANDDVWVHLDANMNSAQTCCRFRFVGLSENSRLGMVFYVRAFSCALENGTVLRPRSLQKYEGISQSIAFDGQLRLECSEKLQMKVIPLAGDDCFWSSTFLVSFELNRNVNSLCYFFRYN